MKKIRLVICCLLLIFAFCSSGFSQNLQGNQNFSAGIGLASNLKLGDYPNYEFEYIILKDPIVQYNLSVVNRTQLPTFYISYSYALDKKIVLGVTGAYENLAGDFKQDKGIVGNYSHQFFTVALEGKYLFLNNPEFSLYSSLGLGCLIYSQNDKFPQVLTFINSTSYHINGYLSPIGMRFGKQFGGFIELGFGYKGILNGGISYRL